MKFLQHDGDSVVSLRFKFHEMPDRYESTESQEIVELPIDTSRALRKIAEAEVILNQRESGDTDVEFGAQEWGDTSTLLAIINNSLGGDLGLLPANDLALFYRMQDRLQAVKDSGEVPGVYLYGDGQQESPPVDELLPGFGETQEREIDLNDLATGVEKEASLLQENVEQYAAHVEVGATALSERAALSAMVEATIEGNPNRATEIGLNKELKREEGGEVGRVATASTVEGLDQNLGATIASLYQDTSDQLNMSPDTLAAQMAAFEAMENA